ncbi:Homeobox protein E30 [Formica fusca]
MEKLRFLNRVVDISEPILAEDSTFSKLALSLSAVLEQLDKNAIHHDYLVALLFVLLAESGFSISSNTLKREQNTRLVHIPTDWKSPETGIYEIHLILHNLENIQLKFIAIPYGDKLIVNIFPCIKEKKTYSMIVQTLKYVNPYSNNPCLRYMNLKEISHKFKDKLTTPLRTDILSVSGLTSPSFQGLPIELRSIIAAMLHPLDIDNLALCSTEDWMLCKHYCLKQLKGPCTRQLKRLQNSKNSLPEEKRSRTGFSAEQLSRLNREFLEDQYVTGVKRQELSRTLNIPEHQIRMWFWNKRMMLKSRQRNMLALRRMPNSQNHLIVDHDNRNRSLVRDMIGIDIILNGNDEMRS